MTIVLYFTSFLSRLLNEEKQNIHTNVNAHGHKDNESEPSVEHCGEIDYCNGDVDQSGQDVENEVLEEAVD